MTTPASILVIDDEPDLLDNLRLALEEAGYQVFTAANGQSALNMLRQQAVNLVLSDIAMPDMNGYQLFEQIQQIPHLAGIPFVFLTARALDSDIRYGKELGVDDYLTKPFRLADLLAVVRGKIRRAQTAQQSGPLARPPAADALMQIGSLKINPAQHKVWRAGQEIQLSAREFALLHHLARHSGDIVSAQKLVQVTHQFNATPAEAGSLIRPLIRTINHKLGADATHSHWLENVRGVGYRLNVPD